MYTRITVELSIPGKVEDIVVPLIDGSVLPPAFSHIVVSSPHALPTLITSTKRSMATLRARLEPGLSNVRVWPDEASGVQSFRFGAAICATCCLTSVRLWSPQASVLLVITFIVLSIFLVIYSLVFYLCRFIRQYSVLIPFEMVTVSLCYIAKRLKNPAIPATIRVTCCCTGGYR